MSTEPKNNMLARFRGGPRDGAHLICRNLPCEVRYVVPTSVSDCDWEHVYVLRGTEETGWDYAYVGYRLVAPPNEDVNCPACDARLPWPSPSATPEVSP